jgi:hypothetical protein
MLVQRTSRDFKVSGAHSTMRGDRGYDTLAERWVALPKRRFCPVTRMNRAVLTVGVFADLIEEEVMICQRYPHGLVPIRSHEPP